MGYCAATSGSHDCVAIGAQWGLLGGALSVSLLDALALAHESAPTKPAYALTASVGPGAIAVSGYW